MYESVITNTQVSCISLSEQRCRFTAVTNFRAVASREKTYDKCMHCATCTSTCCARTTMLNVWDILMLLGKFGRRSNRTAKC